jgi:hypothetical protein
MAAVAQVSLFADRVVREPLLTSIRSSRARRPSLALKPSRRKAQAESTVALATQGRALNRRSSVSRGLYDHRWYACIEITETGRETVA